MSRFLCFVSALVLVAGCGGGGGNTTDGGTDGGTSCESPRQMCGSACVNVQTDPNNCGDCGTTCSGGSVCSEGGCTDSCPAGSTQCGGSCTDTSSDPDHCGSCDEACDADRVCEGGSCECPAGESDCDGACVDTDTDTDNCGLCGRACDPGQTCESGSCTEGTDAGMDAGMDDAGTGMDDAGTGMDDAGMDDAGTGMDDAGTGDGGTTTCPGDSAEDNDTQSTAYALADFTDYPDTMMTFSSFDLNDESDVDWYRFAVSDTGIDGNPGITVSLDQIPTGTDYDLGVWYQCDGTGTTVTCNTGTSDSLGAFEGCTSDAAGDADELVDFETNCSGTDESGIVLIRVDSYSWDSCDPYRLQVTVE